MKNGPAVPGWAVGVGIAVVVVIAGFFLVRAGGGGGPRDPSTYPKEAFSPPGYAASAGGGSDYQKNVQNR
jgi:hypothetical protein